uniref:Putative ovule protein n=1 Tax=Solanum chacoense TaxID=4108 RepID=A0A0V0HNN6_SOLCH
MIIEYRLFFSLLAFVSIVSSSSTTVTFSFLSIPSRTLFTFFILYALVSRKWPFLSLFDFFFIDL